MTVARAPTAWYWFIAWVARWLFFGVLGGAKVIGRDNVPKEGPVLVAPVHVSFLDPPLVGSTCPRQLRFMAKAELFKVPLLGPLIRSLRSFPVSRGTTDSATIRKTLEWLKEGDAVLVFPEGHRGDGQTMSPILSGIAVLAKRTGAQVVPVGLSGTSKMLPKHAKRLRRGRTTIVYGAPFTYTATATTGDEKRDREAFADELARRIAEASAQAGMPVRPIFSSEAELSELVAE